MVRFKKDDFIRPYNPILFDVSEDMSTPDLWAMKRRLTREIEDHRDKIVLKTKSLEILYQELECRNEIYRDDR